MVADLDIHIYKNILSCLTVSSDSTYLFCEGCRSAKQEEE